MPAAANCAEAPLAKVRLPGVSVNVLSVWFTVTATLLVTVCPGVRDRHLERVAAGLGKSDAGAIGRIAAVGAERRRSRAAGQTRRRPGVGESGRAGPRSPSTERLVLVPVTLVDDALAGVATVGGGVGAGAVVNRNEGRSPLYAYSREAKNTSALCVLDEVALISNEAVRLVWKLWFKRAVTSTASVEPIFRLEPAMLTVRPVPAGRLFQVMPALPLSIQPSALSGSSWICSVRCERLPEYCTGVKSRMAELSRPLLPLVLKVMNDW